MKSLLTLLSSFVILHSSLAATQPNVILLMGDDHGWEETGYNGHPHVKTPVLDEMAATGLKLENFYAGASELLAHTREFHDRPSSEPHGHLSHPAGPSVLRRSPAGTS
jgi:hypothetical protein